MHAADDRLPTDPTPEEIREQTRAIRERGFVGKHGRVHRPWDDKRYPSGVVRAGVNVVSTSDFDAAVSEATQ